jgi:predicted metal-dependent hydrolase
MTDKELLQQAYGAFYATQPKKEWVGLTYDEIHEIRLKTLDSVATNYEAYRAIEAKLKEKNSV